uniref:Uncharacterized protein n=1 Tax=Oryza glumipatula TaxID=40148 RepID=A0A0E0AJZ3_9ORYZ
MRYICHKSWLGEWFLPQKIMNYLALKLPDWWWVFGLDQALHVDIDIWSSSLFQSVRRRLNNKK